MPKTVPRGKAEVVTLVRLMRHPLRLLILRSRPFSMQGHNGDIVALGRIDSR